MPNGKIRFAAYYGAGAVMGFTPDQIDKMSLWKLQASIAGYSRAHASESEGALSSSEADEVWQWMQMKDL